MSNKTTRTTSKIEIKDGYPEPLHELPMLPFDQMKVGQYVEMEIINESHYKTIQKRIHRYTQKNPKTKWSLRTVGVRREIPYTVRVYRIANDNDVAEIRSQ